MENKFFEKMNALSDSELLKVIRLKDDYQEEASEAAISIGMERNLIDKNLNVLVEDKSIKVETLEGETEDVIHEEIDKGESKSKSKIIKRLAIVAVFVFFALSFHIVPSEMMIFPKNNLTFSNTIITDNDIKQIIERYNNASFLQKQSMSNEPLNRKLLEKGILEEKK